MVSVCVISIAFFKNKQIAVDLYVLERAMLATHPNSEDLFAQILDSYKSECKMGKMILGKFESVRARGRKRMAFG